MIIYNEVRHHFEKGDLLSITKQLKDKKIKVYEFCKEIGVSRSYFYYCLTSRRDCPIKIINALIRVGVKIPYTRSVTCYF